MSLATAMERDGRIQLPRIVAVGGIVYRRLAGGQVEIVLIKKRYGSWSLPKGRVEYGEAPGAAVLREVLEETSIAGEVERVIHQVSYTVRKAGGQRGKTVTYYLVRACAGRAQPDPREGITRVRWFPLSVALRRIRRDRLRIVLRTAQVLLHSV